MIKKFIVTPRLPERLRPLLEIARNVWWTWSRNAVALFRRIDVDLWEECNHNPVAMLGNIHPERLDVLAQDEAFLAHLDSVKKELDTYLQRKTWYSKIYGENLDIQIAYFSMEFGLHESLPFYSGGLGCLAGDHLKSTDELGLPFVGVSLCYQEGYYRQYLNLDGWQQEHYPENDFYNMSLTPVRDSSGSNLIVQVELPGRLLSARIWKLQIGRVPLFLLDTNIPENLPHDRAITARLYGGDPDMRIRQEILLGIGGVRALHALGYRPTVYHMNEGHSAFLGLERIRQLIADEGLSFDEAREASAAGNAFTTHTPVPAGNERFPGDLIRNYFRNYVKDLKISTEDLLALGRENPHDQREELCMTVMAMRLSCHANGVSKLHGQISRRMWKRVWPGIPDWEIPISHITNGIHAQSWMSDEFARLYERHIGPRFLDEPVNQRIWKRVVDIPDNELWRAKERLRERLVSYVRERVRRQIKRFGVYQRKIASAEEVLDPDILTIGFARRFATYKRATLILRDLPRLKRLLLDRERPLQLIYAGKAHPNDHPGKELIRQIAQLTKDDELRHRVVFIEDYDLDVARHLVQGVDVWLNNPQRPLEASGTSGMKVTVNGGLNLSILDGWWCEGYQGDNGWAIGSGEEYTDREYMDQIESTILYELLEKEIVPLFYKRGPDGLPREWIQIMKNSIRSCCPAFNTNRMVEEYAEKIYLPAAIQWNILSKNHFETARILAAWKSHISTSWHQISVVSVEADTTQELEIGNSLGVAVRVHTGTISPNEIAVEAVYGPLDVGGEIRVGEAMALAFQSAEGPVATFTGAIPCYGAGRYGFAIRVLPFRRELVHKFQMGKITWWTGDSAVPSETVAEKVLGAVK
ncbi:MAG: alpha-glucan family phosphorylase [Planctomycetes bacterium]|nr:alpha-glucan family phosphorylase [Planctomycetota bacterium]